MDAQNFDPLFGKASSVEPIKPTGPKFTIDTKPFYDDTINKAQEEGSVQFASGVVRVSDAPKYPLQETIQPLYETETNLGLSKKSQIKNSVGIGANDSFTEHYEKNKFVPKGFELEAKLLLHEEKIKKLESQYKAGSMGYQTFLFKAYGIDLLKQSGNDIYSSLYWYNRRKQGLFDSPLDNMTQMSALLEQAEQMYKAEEWFNQSNALTLDTTMASYIAEGVLPPSKVRDLFPELFKELDSVYSSDLDKVNLYRAGLLKFPDGVYANA